MTTFITCFSGLLATVVGIFVWKWAAKGVEPELADKTPRGWELRFPRRVKVCVVLAILLGVGLAVLCIAGVSAARDSVGRVMVALGGVVAASLTFILWRSVFASPLYFDDERVVAKTVGRKTTVLRWSSVERWEYSASREKYRVYFGPDSAALTVSAYRNGIGRFLRKLRSHVPEESN